MVEAFDSFIPYKIAVLILLDYILDLLSKLGTISSPSRKYDSVSVPSLINAAHEL